MKHKYSLFALLFLLFFFSCQHKAEEAAPSGTDDKWPVAAITGKIVLPAGAILQPSTLTVLSSWGNSAVTNTAYSLDVIGKFSTLFATNPAGEIMLMRYNFPGQSDYDLTPQSTAVALLMTSPVMQSLTEEGRLAAIQRLLADADYPRLVAAISASIVAGKPVTDQANSQLLAILKRMFDTASTMRVQAVGRLKPIVIKRMNTTISLRNNRVAHDYVAGLYKDGVKVGSSIVIKGTPMFAASIYDAIRGAFFEGYSEPDQQLLTLPGDGNFSLRIRSGWRDKPDKSPEFREARERNTEDYLIGILLEHFPIPNDCSQGVREALYNVPGNAALIANAFEATSVAQFSTAMLTLAGNTVEGSANLVNACGSLKAEKIVSLKEYLLGLSKYFKYLDLVGKVGFYGNISAHLYDLYFSTAAIDTCFMVRGQAVSPCNCLPPTDPMMQLLTGGSSQTWKLTGIRADPNRLPVTILGQAPTITFRANNTNINTEIFSSQVTNLTGGGTTPRTVKFNLTGNTVEGSYCLNRRGTGYEFGSQENDYLVTSPDANTLILINTSEYVRISTFLYHEELTYTKQ